MPINPAITLPIMFYLPPKLTPDEKAFHNVDIMLPESLANKVKSYASIVSDTGKLAQKIRQTNKKLEKHGLTFEDLKKIPNQDEVVLIQNMIRQARREVLPKLSELGGNNLSEIKKIIAGLELIQTLEVCSPFLDDAQKQAVEDLTKITTFIADEKIFLAHGIPSWPRELSDKRVRPLFREYHEIIRAAIKTINKPPQIQEIPHEPAHLAAMGTEDRGIRKQALAEIYLPEQLQNDHRLEAITTKELAHRAKCILSLTDQHVEEMHRLLEQSPKIIFTAAGYQKFVRRTTLLNTLARFNPKEKHSSYDPVLAHDLRAAFLEHCMKGNDKDFFALYTKIRTQVASDRADPNLRYPVIDQRCIDTIFPQASHPLANQPFSSDAFISFLKSDAYKTWASDPRTIEGYDTLIITKMTESHTGAPKEDWIKANFGGKKLPAPALEALKDSLKKLIKEGRIQELMPGLAKSPLRLA